MLPKVISGLSILLRDDSALVKKRVVQGLSSIYRNTLQWVCSSEDVTDELERCWDSLCYIKVSCFVRSLKRLTIKKASTRHKFWT